MKSLNGNGVAQAVDALLASAPNLAQIATRDDVFFLLQQEGAISPQGALAIK